jgi:DNA processing protein
MKTILALSTLQFPSIARATFHKDLSELHQGRSLKDIWESWGVHGLVQHTQVMDECLRDEECLRELRAEIIYPGHPEYPLRYLLLESPPLCLSYIGSPVWMDSRALAGVGSREPHPFTLDWMREELMPFLRTQRLVTVSGGARGVDQELHELSLAAGVPTVVHIPSGLNAIYPRSLDRLVPEVVTNGCVISKFRPSAIVKPFHFHERNELIAQMSSYVLILEARLKSGTGLTAQFAIRNNIPIGAVPGHPLLRQFAGSLKLIGEGVDLICDRKDLLLSWSRCMEKIYFQRSLGLEDASN